MVTYEELKAELVEIAKFLDQFPEQIKPLVFETLVENFLTDKARTVKPKERRSGRSTGSREADRAKNRPVVKKSSGGKESYSIDRELDLRGNKSIPSFKQFVEDKKPNTAKEFNAVTVYYLKKILGRDKATLDHAYTCYVEAGRRPPGAFKQSFTDTKNREGWVEFSADGHLQIPHRGAVFVEHDLPPKEKSAKSP